LNITYGLTDDKFGEWEPSKSPRASTGLLLDFILILSRYQHKILPLENVLNKPVFRFLTKITSTYLIIVQFVSRKS